MKRINKTEAYSIRIKPYALALTLIWSAIVIGSLVWNVHQARQGTLDVARIQARDAFMKDVIYRRWNAKHGGVYVPATDKTPPNPYLNVPERDLTTPSGIALTLMNPAYMTRQVHEMASKTYGVRGHITSLNPIRPANAPDPWETQALEAFEDGAKEFSSVEKLNGDDHMRLMQPLLTEKGCLKCHAGQGYKAGDIRGGISVSVPMSPFWAVESSNIKTLSLGHSFLWMVGLVGIGIGARRLSKQITNLKQADEEVIRAKQDWERTFNTVPDLIAILDDKHRIIRVNRAMADRLGVTPEEAVGLTCYEHVHGTQEPPEYCPHSKLLADAQEHFTEVHEKKLGGDFLITVTPFHDTKRHLVGSVHMARDITERKRAEKRNRKLNRLNENLIVSGDLTEKLKRITDSIVEIFNADFARIWIAKAGDLCNSGCIHAEVVNGLHVCENRDMCLHLLSSSGRYTDTNGGHRRVPYGAYKIGRIASEMDSKFLTNDVVHDPRVHDNEWASKLGLKSFAGYRLLSEVGKPIGVLALFSKQAISLDTSVLLQGLANTTSHVIQTSFKEDVLRTERDKLKDAITKIRILSGMLPICSSCKKIRDDKGYWNHIESYIRDHSDAEFSHGICPECAKKLYPDLDISK